MKERPTEGPLTNQSTVGLLNVTLPIKAQDYNRTWQFIRVTEFKFTEMHHNYDCL